MVCFLGNDQMEKKLKGKGVNRGRCDPRAFSMAPDFSGRSRDINVWLAVNAECDCCDKHKCGRPYFWKGWKETTPHFTQNPDCKCDCRHNARIVCRMHPDTIEQWVEAPTMIAKGRELTWR